MRFLHAVAQARRTRGHGPDQPPTPCHALLAIRRGTRPGWFAEWLSSLGSCSVERGFGSDANSRRSQFDRPPGWRSRVFTLPGQGRAVGRSGSSRQCCGSCRAGQGGIPAHRTPYAGNAGVPPVCRLCTLHRAGLRQVIREGAEGDRSLPEATPGHAGGLTGRRQPSNSWQSCNDAKRAPPCLDTIYTLAQHSISRPKA